MKIFKVCIVASLGFLVALTIFIPKYETQKYETPVTAVVNGEEMPVISARIYGNYIEIETDSGEKILATNTSVIIYETEIYYEEDKL